MTALDVPLLISLFDRAIAPKGEAIGTLEQTTWGDFVKRLSRRREGQKDGPCFAVATFAAKPGGRHVGRKKNGALSRTAIALDIETSKATGEIPPPPVEALSRARHLGLACAIYSSHSHTARSSRYRVVIPLSDEIACDIPACEIMAEDLGLVGVLDTSKVGPASLFYLPSCVPGHQRLHYFDTVDGEPVDADRITETGIGLLRARKAAQDIEASEAQTLAAVQREAKIAAGFDPDDSLIDKIRVHLDLEKVLLSYGYDKKGQNFRHPNSSSGMHGASIKNLGGIDRVFSHNATCPLHAENLPEWCGVTAIDAFDVIAILNFSGDRNKALQALAERYGFTKSKENKALAALMFRLIKRQASQEQFNTSVSEESARLGLSHQEAQRVAKWVIDQSVQEAA